jgi:predicted nucleic acid-binding protein
VKPVLLDTGVIVAWLDRSERFHEAAVSALDSCESPLITCEAVIAESCYRLRKLKGAAEAVLANVAEGVFQMPFSLAESAEEVRRIVNKYREREIALADACLIQMAAAFDTPEIMTLDKDFQVYRWQRNKMFKLLIALD